MRGIRAISVDPAARSITAIETSREVRLLRDFFRQKPKLAARLPKGDSLLITAMEYGEAFTVGGTRPSHRSRRDRRMSGQAGPPLVRPHRHR
ncbi:hypothetical protein XI04_20735 [Bradyrhizobium sp. CCBAU 11430]|nr:hypothetical protein [Bradyrhizobium sp. CCBAU 25360]MDA9456593.1 hypothetical protein [Bradyrhizobium sp. CCBAU 21359]MDA9515467.1 hypothetical protein [Bradyrhizobium sp. CCBAU 11430]